MARQDPSPLVWRHFAKSLLQGVQLLRKSEFWHNLEASVSLTRYSRNALNTLREQAQFRHDVSTHLDALLSIQYLRTGPEGFTVCCRHQLALTVYEERRRASYWARIQRLESL